MKTSTYNERILELSSFTGIMGGMGMLVLAYLMPEMRFLTLPAFLVLIPSLIYGTR